MKDKHLNQIETADLKITPACMRIFSKSLLQTNCYYLNYITHAYKRLIASQTNKCNHVAIILVSTNYAQDISYFH